MSLFRRAIRRSIVIALLFLSTVGCDQLSKVMARDALRFHPPLSYLGDGLRLQYAQNNGAFLSLGSDLQERTRFWIFTVSVAVAMILAIVTLARRQKMDLWMTIAWTLVVAGGCGNLIDRIVFGSVTDFLNLGIGSLRTGIFNVADVAIVAGVIGLLVMSYRPKISDRNGESRF